MTEQHQATGYGPSTLPLRRDRLIFDGDDRNFERWEIKFMGYMRLRGLKNVLVGAADPDEEKNEEAFAELIQFLDDRSLSLIMRDARDNGRKAFQILRNHYAGKGKPRIISLYTELTSLVKSPNENVTDYMIRAETAATALRSAEEVISDSLLIAMVLKGLPDSFKSFVVVVTQNDKTQSFCDFKVALRNFEDTEKTRAPEDHTVMKAASKVPSMRLTMKCFKCGIQGHMARNCNANAQHHGGTRKKRMWCHHCESETHNSASCRRREKHDKAKQTSDESDGRTFVFKNKDCDVGTTGYSLLVDCGATSHIITDESKFIRFDDSFSPSQHFIELANGTRSNSVALKKGDASVNLVDSNRNCTSATLKGALYIPSYPHDIFSVQAAAERGATVNFRPTSAELSYKDGTTFNIEKCGKLYYLRTSLSNNCDVVKYACDLQEWHKILGHCNYDDVMQLQNVVKGMHIVGKSKPKDCKTCVLGKMMETRSRIPDTRATEPMGMVHVDLAGLIEPVSDDSFRYAAAFTDDYTGATFVYFLKSKTDTLEATNKFLADSAPFGKIKVLRSDNGSEFTSKAFQSVMVGNKIRHETSAPYSPHQNGTAERQWRTLFEMGRCLLTQANLPKRFWPYAVLAAAYIRNRCFNNRMKQCPYYLLTGRTPNLGNMRVFGSDCYVYKQNKQKLDDRCVRGIFFGYDKNSSCLPGLFSG
ncbi:Uncharacterised protein r2_g1167 [Pycnogonum litorale]